MSLIIKARTWIEWLRNNFTPSAWKEIFEAGKALIDLLLTFGYFFIYPFIESCKAFWIKVAKPFWSHCKVAWARIVNKAKILWKELLDVFNKKKEEEVVEPAIDEPKREWY